MSRDCHKENDPHGTIAEEEEDEERPKYRVGTAREFRELRESAFSFDEEDDIMDSPGRKKIGYIGRVKSLRWASRPQGEEAERRGSS